MLKSYSVVNLYMAKFVEMDEKVTLKDQMQEIRFESSRLYDCGSSSL